MSRTSTAKLIQEEEMYWLKIFAIKSKEKKNIEKKNEEITYCEVAPHSGQNLLSSPNLLPQFGQNISSFSSSVPV